MTEKSFSGEWRESRHEYGLYLTGYRGRSDDRGKSAYVVYDDPFLAAYVTPILKHGHSGWECVICNPLIELDFENDLRGAWFNEGTAAEKNPWKLEWIHEESAVIARMWVDITIEQIMLLKGHYVYIEWPSDWISQVNQLTMRNPPIDDEDEEESS